MIGNINTYGSRTNFDEGFFKSCTEGLVKVIETIVDVVATIFKTVFCCFFQKEKTIEPEKIKPITDNPTTEDVNKIGTNIINPKGTENPTPNALEQQSQQTNKTAEPEKNLEEKDLNLENKNNESAQQQPQLPLVAGGEAGVQPMQTNQQTEKKQELNVAVDNPQQQNLTLDGEGTKIDDEMGINDEIGVNNSNQQPSREHKPTPLTFKKSQSLQNLSLNSSQVLSFEETNVVTPTIGLDQSMILDAAPAGEGKITATTEQERKKSPPPQSAAKKAPPKKQQNQKRGWGKYNKQASLKFSPVKSQNSSTGIVNRYAALEGQNNTNQDSEKKT